jgi:hypothetical protein
VLKWGSHFSTDAEMLMSFQRMLLKWSNHFSTLPHGSLQNEQMVSSMVGVKKSIICAEMNFLKC